MRVNFQVFLERAHPAFLTMNTKSAVHVFSSLLFLKLTNNSSSCLLSFILFRDMYNIYKYKCAEIIYHETSLDSISFTKDFIVERTTFVKLKKILLYVMFNILLLSN